MWDIGLLVAILGSEKRLHTTENDDVTDSGRRFFLSGFKFLADHAQRSCPRGLRATRQNTFMI